MCSSLLTVFCLLLPLFVFGQNYSECGISDRQHHHDIQTQELIINGIPCSLGEWPWAVTVNMYNNGTHVSFCSGSILDPNWVLTAAHCCEGYERYEVGTKALFYADVIVVDVLNATIPENFNLSRYGYDICLLELANPLIFDNETAPVCLSRNSGPEVGEILMVTGFGQIQLNTTDGFGYLKEGFIPVRDCSEWHLPENMRPPEPDSFCSITNEESAYFGDSGGPLVSQRDDGRWVQAGLVSGGTVLDEYNGENKTYVQGVHTTVAYYCDWIAEVTHGEVLCGD